MKSLASITRKLVDGNSHDVFRNMAILALGTGSAKLIGLAAIPLLTRLYSPGDFGVLSVFTALVLILAPVVTLRYVMAVPLPGNDRLAINVFVLCLGLLGINTLLLAVALWALGPWLLPLFSMQALVPYWWLIVLGILGTGLYELMTLWATRKKVFKPVAASQVWQLGVGSAVKIVLGLLAVKPLGLLIGQVMQQGSGSLALSRRFWSGFAALWPQVTRSRLSFVFRRYAELPRYRLPAQFLLIFSMQAPLLFSAALFGAEATGQLGLALMALGLPIQLLGQTTGKAYFGEISAIGKQHPRRIRQVSLTVLKRMFLLSLPPCLLLLMGGPWLFTVAFGAQWQQAGVLASILAIYLLFQFLSTPLVNALTVFGKQKTFLLINTVRTAIVAGVFLTAYLTGASLTQTITAYSFLLAGHYLFTLWVIFTHIK